MIDVTITATLRPELFDRTLAGFRDNLFGGSFDKAGCRAVVNIDPVGPEGATQADVAELVRGYFSKAEIHMPRQAHFGRAFHRVWSAVSEKADWVFHLEEDWEMLRPVDLARMVEILDTEAVGRPDVLTPLALLRLPMFPSGEIEMKNWNRCFPWNGRYFECPMEIRHRVGFCGHPSLIRARWVRDMTVWLDPDRNPEKQFQGSNPEIGFKMIFWRYGVFARPGQPPTIRDMGRDWMKRHDFAKQGPKAFFTRWTRSEGPHA
ncbi:MAG: hypothetical protein KKB20_07035 [Proteobacteria bacterium]|nr:hypothetical protein [Pseudomonadota bacterium]